MDREEQAVVEAAFIAGFREAPDKQAFLTLAGIPREIERSGKLGLKLIDVKLEDRFSVGAAAPGFGSRELSYQPLPGALVKRSTQLSFIYLSADGFEEKTLAELRSMAAAASHEHSHDGHHHRHGEHEHGHHHAKAATVR